MCPTMIIPPTNPARIARCQERRISRLRLLGLLGGQDRQKIPQAPLGSQYRQAAAARRPGAGKWRCATALPREFILVGRVLGQENLANLFQIHRFRQGMQCNEKGVACWPLPQGSTVPLVEDCLHDHVRSSAPHLSLLFDQIDGRCSHPGNGENGLFHPTHATGAVHAENVNLVDFFGRGVLICDDRGPISGLNDRRHYPIRIATTDASTLFHQVDRRLPHPLYSKDGLLDPADATGTVHVFHIEQIILWRKFALRSCRPRHRFRHCAG